MKNLLLILFIIGCSCAGFGQVDTISQFESTRIEQPRPPINVVPPKDTPEPVKRRVTDSSILKARYALLRNAALSRAKTLRDSLAADSMRKASVPVDHLVVKDTSTYKKYETHPYLPLNKTAVFMIIDYHKHEPKDDLFYLMAGIVFFLAFIRAGFSKYFRNLFLLFFQTSLRQKHTREQLLQEKLASLFTNLLFFISAGLYLTLLVKYKHWTPASFWVLALICASVLVLIYLGKYLFLLFAGWVFNTKEAAGSYIFLVFMVNKVMGIALVPFLLVMSFADSSVVDIAITASFGLIGLLFAYRYVVSFGALRNKLKVNVLHFFLYLCAVEVLPLLLIYKGLINYIAGSF